jgi:hypothetical protein
VVRLKQVEHVRNERNVLAGVAGHPFITTMVASFQDRDSLYMLVSTSKINNITKKPMLIVGNSLIIALEAKYSAIFDEPDDSMRKHPNFMLPKLC